MDARFMIDCPVDGAQMFSQSENHFSHNFDNVRMRFFLKMFFAHFMQFAFQFLVLHFLFLFHIVASSLHVSIATHHKGAHYLIGKLLN